MITKYQADLENNHVRGITNYTPPTYTYIGLSTVAIDDSEMLPENAEPDASTGYARIRVRNNSETWNDSVNGIISNKIRIEFPNEFTANAGVSSCVSYNYASNDYESLNFFKIRNVTEYAGTEIDERKAGNSVNFVYEMNETKITNSINNDDVPYGKETEIWQFDHEGQATAVLDSTGNMLSNIYYNETGGKKHKLKHTNDSGKYTNNLLKNTYANDNLANWTVDNWIQSSADPASLVSVDTTSPNLGTKCFAITRGSVSDAPWPILRQRVKIQKKSYDRKFTFSGDIKLPSDLSGGSGASLHIASFGSNGQQMSGDEYGKWLQSETDWTRESVTINVPAGATEIECAFGIKESVGTAYFDCLQLEESNTANDYNMVENSSFDNNLEKWEETQNTDASVEDGRLKITGDSGVYKKVSQEIFINKKNPFFAIRANAQGVSVPNKENLGIKYCIECKLNLEGNISKTKNIWFNPDVSNVQSVYQSIFPADYGEDKTVTSIVVSPCFDINCNTVYFDNIQVCIDDGGTTYDRNEKGISTKITDNTGSYEECTVNGDSELTQIKDARDNQINFDYNNSPDKVHQLKDCTVKHENVDVKTALDYDLYGNVTSTSTQKSDLSGKKIETSAQYTQNGNYISKQTDSRGKDTEFTVNENNGNVTKTKNPNNVETNYVHTRADRLASETCGNAQTSYSYLNGVISSISHKVAEGVNTVYDFICDMFGNISEIKVGERTLAKNTYDTGNGLIRQTKYGNEQTVNYEYDDKGRLVKNRLVMKKEINLVKLHIHMMIKIEFRKFMIQPMI